MVEGQLNKLVISQPLLLWLAKQVVPCIETNFFFKNFLEMGFLFPETRKIKAGRHTGIKENKTSFWKILKTSSFPLKTCWKIKWNKTLRTQILTKMRSLRRSNHFSIMEATWAFLPKYKEQVYKAGPCLRVQYPYLTRVHPWWQVSHFTVWVQGLTCLNHPSL